MPTPPSKTIFIVDTGASKEAGLPTGSELKSIIARVLGFDDGHRMSPTERKEGLRKLHIAKDKLNG